MSSLEMDKIENGEGSNDVNDEDVKSKHNEDYVEVKTSSKRTILLIVGVSVAVVAVLIGIACAVYFTGGGKACQEIPNPVNGSSICYTASGNDKDYECTITCDENYKLSSVDSNNNNNNTITLKCTNGRGGLEDQYGMEMPTCIQDTTDTPDGSGEEVLTTMKILTTIGNVDAETELPTEEPENPEATKVP